MSRNRLLTYRSKAPRIAEAKLRTKELPQTARTKFANRATSFLPLPKDDSSSAVA